MKQHISWTTEEQKRKEVKFEPGKVYEFDKTFGADITRIVLCLNYGNPGKETFSGVDLYYFNPNDPLSGQEYGQPSSNYIKGRFKPYYGSITIEQTK